MKKIITTLTILLSHSLSFSQDCVKYEVNYQPNNKYNSTQITTSRTVLEYSGSEAFLERLAQKGYTNPSIIEDTQTVTTNIETFKLGNKNKFNIKFELLKSKNNQIMNGSKKESKNPDFSLISLFGKSTLDSKLELDSIVCDNMDEEMKNSFIGIFQSFGDIYTLPINCMKIGDELLSEKPFELPMQGLNPIKMKIHSKYILEKTEGKLACFKVSQTYILDNKNNEFEISASGTGEGFMVVDTETKYIVKNTSTLELNMKMTLGDVIIEMQSISGDNTTIGVIKK
jgi:ribonuclease HI